MEATPLSRLPSQDGENECRLIVFLCARERFLALLLCLPRQLLYNSAAKIIFFALKVIMLFDYVQI